MIKLTMNRPNCIEEVKYLMNIVVKFTSNADFNITNYRPIISVKISPNYKYELGYCRGSKSNHTVIMKLYEHINGHWQPFILPLTEETYDHLFSVLRITISTMPNGKQELAEDILYIYNRTNPKNHNNSKWNTTLIKRINQMSYKYPERDCLDMWLEWLYLVMIAEFYPKIKGNHLVKSYLGKKITFIGIYQCFNTKMTPKQIKKFSCKKNYIYLSKLFKQYFNKFQLQVYCHPTLIYI